MLGRLLGSDVTLRHAGWLSAGAGLLLSLAGIYGIDVATRLDAPAGGTRLGLSPVALKQAMFLGVGILAAAVVALPRQRLLRAVALPLAVVMLGLLVFMLVPFVPRWLVTPRNGARAWINFGPVDFQPAEIAKIAYILITAEYLRARQSHRTVLGLLPVGLIAFVPAALITLQPDLGTALLFVPTVFAMLLASGARLRHLSAAVLIGMLAAPAAFPLLKPHQKARIVGLVRMMQDSTEGADDINYQSLTAQTLTGAGRLTGVPDARSRALVRYNRLPERHNDMIFAVLVNRWGLAGGLVILGLYGVWFAGAYATAALCPDPFGRLVVVGCAALIAAQTFINLGMTLGMLPIIGITLPFVSYGGSSMLSVWLMTGLVVNVAMRPRVRLARPAFEFDEAPYDPHRPPSGHRLPPRAVMRTPGG